MSVSPVIKEARGLIEPGFYKAKGDREIPPESNLFLRSFSFGRNGNRQYFGVAQLVHLGCRRDKRKSRAIRSLREAFARAKEKETIPQNAEFEVIETIESGTGVTLRWAGAMVSSWGSYIGRPTVCD